MTSRTFSDFYNFLNLFEAKIHKSERKSVLLAKLAEI